MSTGPVELGVALVVEVHGALHHYRYAVGGIDPGGKVVRDVIPLSQDVLDHHRVTGGRIHGDLLFLGGPVAQHIGYLHVGAGCLGVLYADVGVEAGAAGPFREVV